jgi:hypothetical protein
MAEDHFKNEKNETNYASSKSFCKIGAHPPTSPCTTITITITIAKVSSSH